MSSQSIKKFNVIDTLDSIDNFLICEGNAFRNIVDYDLKMKVDYEKIRFLLKKKKMIQRTNDCDEVIKLINKTLI